MTAIPFPSLSGSQNSRSGRLKQVIALTIGLIWLCGFATVKPCLLKHRRPGRCPRSDRRQARGIQLRTQTVDATIRQTPDRVLADTILWVKLNNPGKAAVVMPVALGGPQLGPRTLPQILDVTLDNQPIDLASLEPFTARADGGPIIAYTLPITVPLKGSTALRVHYSQMLADQGGLVSYTYPITATARSNSAPESLRMTVKFSPPLPTDQVLSHAPAARVTIGTGSRGIGMRSARKPASVSPSCRPTGGAISQQSTPPRPHRLPVWRNTSRAEPLLSPPVRTPAARFRCRRRLPRPQLPSEIAELQAALATPAQGAPADRAAIHLRLAEILLAHAERLGINADSAYLQSAASELEAATRSTIRMPAWGSPRAYCMRQLAEAAGAHGDQATAAQHRARRRGPERDRPGRAAGGVGAGSDSETCRPKHSHAAIWTAHGGWSLRRTARRRSRWRMRHRHTPTRPR